MFKVTVWIDNKQLHFPNATKLDMNETGNMLLLIYKDVEGIEHTQVFNPQYVKMIDKWVEED